MDTPILDHLIRSGHSFYSFFGSGLIEKLAWEKKYTLTFVRDKQIQQELERLKQAVEKQKTEIKEAARQEGEGKRSTQGN